MIPRLEHYAFTLMFFIWASSEKLVRNKNVTGMEIGPINPVDWNTMHLR